MSAAKVTLSSEELQLVADAGLILTKNRIIGKVYDLFGILSEEYKSAMQLFPQSLTELAAASPKIAKGEQYQGLPWVMLDYPRHFTREDVFAIRSFFWWGKGCSITLQLGGETFERYAASIFSILEKQPEDWLIGVNNDAWEHHFDETNMMPVSAHSLAIAKTKDFLKISALAPLTAWDTLPAFFISRFHAFGGLLQEADQAPMR
jgi:hypothetical protein